jgi:hypothetical protein
MSVFQGKTDHLTERKFLQLIWKLSCLDAGRGLFPRGRRSYADHPGVRLGLVSLAPSFFFHTTSTALLRPADAGTSSAVDGGWEMCPEPKGEES